MICDRTTLVIERQLTSLRGRTVTPYAPVWAPKDPVSTVVRRADFTNLLGSRAATGVAYAADGASIVGATLEGSVVNLVVQGGVDQVPARVELRLLCADGTDETATIMLPMVANILLPEGQTVPANFTTTTTGATAGALGPLPILATSGASAKINGTVVVRDPIAGSTSSWDVAALVRGLGSAQIGIDQASLSVTAFQSDGPLASCGVSVSASSGGVLVIVMGVTGLALSWSGGFAWEVV